MVYGFGILRRVTGLKRIDQILSALSTALCLCVRRRLRASWPFSQWEWPRRWRPALKLRVSGTASLSPRWQGLKTPSELCALTEDSLSFERAALLLLKWEKKSPKDTKNSLSRGWVILVESTIPNYSSTWDRSWCMLSDVCWYRRIPC